MSTQKERTYLAQALLDFKIVTYGQFDSETVTRPPITQDAASEIQHLDRLLTEFAAAVRSEYTGFNRPPIPPAIQSFLDRLKAEGF